MPLFTLKNVHHTPCKRSHPYNSQRIFIKFIPNVTTINTSAKFENQCRPIICVGVMPLFIPHFFEENLGDIDLASSVRPSVRLSVHPSVRPESYLRNGLTDFTETWYKYVIPSGNAALQVWS